MAVLFCGLGLLSLIMVLQLLGLVSPCGGPLLVTQPCAFVGFLVRDGLHRYLRVSVLSRVFVPALHGLLLLSAEV